MNAIKSPERIRCLVLQLARLGDTIQSLMALRAAKQLYPQLEITLLVHESFADAARRVDWIEEVICLPTEKILAPVLKDPSAEGESLKRLATWLRPRIARPFDLAVNWSYSESSSFLMSLVPAKVKLGYSRRKDVSFSAIDGWSHFVQAIIQGGIEQNIHLTDALTTQLLTALQIHYGEPKDAGDESVTSKAFFQRQAESDSQAPWLQPGTRWVGIQLGASRADRRWEPESWAKLASLILRRHDEYHVALLAGPRESELADRFLSALTEDLGSQSHCLSRVHNLAGDTTFDAWTDVIGACQWLLATDTAAVHLASVLGTRVLNVSVGSARYFETGPYGNGHYVVTPAQPESPLLPGAVYATWTYAVTEWQHRRQLPLATHAQRLSLSSELDSAQVMRSRIRGADHGGGVVYEPITSQPMSLGEWNAQFLGHLARAWYCGWTPPIGEEIARDRIRPELVQSLRQLEDAADVLGKITREAILTAKKIESKSARLPSEKVMKLSDRTELQEMAQKLLELESLIDRLSEAQPALTAFSRMVKVLMHNVQGSTLTELGRESAISFQLIHQGVEILASWVDHTLGLAKPVAIAGANVVAFRSPSKEQ